MYGPTISSFPCNIVIPAQYRHSRAISSFPRNIVIPAQYRHSRVGGESILNEVFQLKHFFIQLEKLKTVL